MQQLIKECNCTPTEAAVRAPHIVPPPTLQMIRFNLIKQKSSAPRNSSIQVRLQIYAKYTSFIQLLIQNLLLITTSLSHARRGEFKQ
ncbi:hypothetical protein CDAR_193451 [Caerostris darwini]|uniref:Uncharacterized protein n=1 Tax=Caerostris darwini TaxID=1538125 RepID=A0AAV4RN33_9ARAC|nr:hypothetical protein CDAR_193451 [Caerostris darwini]